MDTKFKGKIIAALRRLSYSWPPRNNVKRRVKVDLCTFRCESCDDYIYDGSSDSTFQKVLLRHTKTVRKGKVHVDHKEPVIPLQGFKSGEWDWDEFIKRMYCPIEDLQVLCKECHDKKTDSEKEVRKTVRKTKKK